MEGCRSNRHPGGGAGRGRNFAEAERYQLKALSLLSADEALRSKFQARLKQYRAKQPVRQEIAQG